MLISIVLSTHFHSLGVGIAVCIWEYILNKPFLHHLFGKKREDTVFNQLFCSLIYTYTCVQNAYSTERQKREINAGEGKNHRVKGR